MTIIISVMTSILPLLQQTEQLNNSLTGGNVERFRLLHNKCFIYYPNSPEQTNMNNHAPENYKCPFCLLIQGIENEHVYSTQSDIVFQDDTITAFISSHQWPNNLGNTIIIPNQHFENIYDFPLEYAYHTHKMAKRLAMAMKEIYHCDGISTRQHNEPAGNQDVWHYHLHITPRYQNDNYYHAQRKLMPVLERQRHAKMLRKTLFTIQLDE